MLSMWVIFLTGAIISIFSYIIAGNNDFVSGIQNTVDLIIIIIIIISILVWGKNKQIQLESFERKYLLSAMIILIIWYLSNNAFYSNLLTQILMTSAYFPTIQKLLKEKKNKESFSGWLIIFMGQLFAMYPAFSKGNLLAQAYVIRAEFMTIVLLSTMTYYHFLNNKQKDIHI